MTKQLARWLGLPLTLHPTLAPTRSKRKATDPKEYRQDSAAPEVALMAVLIMVLKLVYGLDGQSR